MRKVGGMVLLLCCWLSIYQTSRIYTSIERIKISHYYLTPSPSSSFGYHPHNKLDEFDPTLATL